MSKIEDDFCGFPHFGSTGTPPCSFIPVYLDEPTETTSRLLEHIYIDADNLDSDLIKLVEATRRRSVSGMACIKCGKKRNHD